MVRTQDIPAMLAAAQVPQYAATATLSSLNQNTLRAVISDRAYRSKGVLKSISIRQSPAQSARDFALSYARFAAELVIVGESVLYIGARTLAGELRRYESGADLSDFLTPVLRHRSILVVPGFDALSIADAAGAARVGEHLLQHESSGGALVMPTLHNAEYTNGRPDLGVLEPALHAMLTIVTDGRGSNV